MLKAIAISLAWSYCITFALTGGAIFAARLLCCPGTLDEYEKSPCEALAEARRDADTAKQSTEVVNPVGSSAAAAPVAAAPTTIVLQLSPPTK